MHITLIPVRMDSTLTLHRKGDVLTVNALELDFSPLPEGAILPREAVGCDWLASDVTRQDGQIRLSLVLPHGADAPAATRYPEPIILVRDGAVVLPARFSETLPGDML